MGILSEGARTGSLLQWQKSSCAGWTVRTDALETDEVTWQSGWHLTVLSIGQWESRTCCSRDARGSCTMHLACGMTEEHLVKIRVQAGLPKWLFEINKCCISPHSDCLTSCCWEGNVSMLCMILVFWGLAECSGTSSPKEHLVCVLNLQRGCSRAVYVAK